MSTESLATDLQDADETNGGGRGLARQIGKRLMMTLGPVLAALVELELDGDVGKGRPEAGYLGLQDHGRPNEVRFRNVWLKEL